MKKLKQILAIISIILLVLLAVASLVVACLNFPGKEQLFFALMGSTIFLPIILWIIIWMVGVMTNKKTIASFRSEEMDQTMQKADEIRAAQESDDTKE